MKINSQLLSWPVHKQTNRETSVDENVTPANSGDGKQKIPYTKMPFYIRMNDTVYDIRYDIDL